MSTGDNDGKALVGQHEHLKGQKAPVASVWQEILDLILPEAGPAIGTVSPGEKGRTKVLDETPEQANEVLAAGIYGITTNPAQAWVGVRSGIKELNEDPIDGGWMEEVSASMLDRFGSPLGAFPQVQPQFIAELATLGTSHKYIWPDKYGRPMFMHCPTASMCIAENAAGRVDTWFREFDWTAKQAFEEFGPECPPKIAERAQDPKRQDEVFTFLHCVKPNVDVRDGAIHQKFLPWMSWYLWRDEAVTIRRRGQHESRYVTGRWTLRREAGSRTVWGRGPGHKALASSKLLQAVMKETLHGLQNAVRPPLMVADDGVMGSVRMGPGALNTVRMDGRQPPIQKIDTGARPDMGEDFNEGVRKRIRESFYWSQMQTVRQFLTAYSKPPTKAEVLALKEEELRVLGPIVGRILAEDLIPTINIVYSIMSRGNFFPPMPPRLRRLPEFKLEFDNPITQAQRVSGANAVVSTLEVMAPVINLKPSVLDNVDEDKVFRTVADGFGWPKGTMRSKEEVAERRAADAEREAGMQAIAEAGGIAAAAKDAASAATMGAPA